MEKPVWRKHPWGCTFSGTMAPQAKSPGVPETMLLQAKFSPHKYRHTYYSGLEWKPFCFFLSPMLWWVKTDTQVLPFSAKFQGAFTCVVFSPCQLWKDSLWQIFLWKQHFPETWLSLLLVETPPALFLPPSLVLGAFVVLLIYVFTSFIHLIPHGDPKLVL